MERRTFQDPRVKAAFDAYPAGLRRDLLRLRALIFDTARQTGGVGELVETTKWGQPAYVPLKPKTGTTIRIDAVKNEPGRYGMFFHCQTTLIGTFRAFYGDRFSIRGNRALVFSEGDSVDVDALRHCIAMSLTYHMEPKRSAAS